MLVLILAGIIGYVIFLLPNVGAPPDIQVELTDENIERGRYLANHVMLCIDCHAVRDFKLFAGKS